jgi:hypothetical protein
MDGQINLEAVSALNDLEVYAQQRGARVFFIYPALEQGAYMTIEKEINLLAGIFKKELKVPVLGAPSRKL